MIHSLSIHASYSCRHAGACCTSGWPIPIEAPAAVRVNDSLRAHRLHAPGVASEPDWLEPTAGSPAGTAGMLRTAASGACVFHDGRTRRCAVHRDLGHGALPLACRQFPRIVLADARGTFVTLSHYCPTAASLLLTSTPLAIVASPSAFAPDAEYDALDARRELPPLLHGTVLMDMEGYAAWEAFLVSALGREGAVAEDVLGRAALVVEDVRAWRPGGETLAERIRRCGMRVAESRPIDRGWTGTGREQWWYQRVLEAVPVGVSRPMVPEGLDELWRERVQPAWVRWSPAIGRYVAAHAFASWTAYQGHGLRAIWRSIAAALMVLRVESARQAASGTFGQPELLEAIRHSDLLLRHLADRQALADQWNAMEHEPIAECGMRIAD